jgi:16S rRNA C1402 (ribose-2'-O) methylase RsmI
MTRKQSTMKTLKEIYGKREIMLVAHRVAKECKQSMSKSLKESWAWFKKNSSTFKCYLGVVIKEKRKQILSGFNLKRAILSQPVGTASTYTFQNQVFDEKYNILFQYR